MAEGLSEAEELELLELENKNAHAMQAQGEEGLLTNRGKQMVSNFARPALEVGGAVGGGLLGAGGGGIAIPGVGTVPGLAAGGALGFATGKTAADGLDRMLGLKEPLSGLPEAGKEVVGAIGDGMMAESGGAALNMGVKAAAPIGKRLLSVLTGPSVEAIEARAAGALDKAKPIDAIARELPEGVQTLATKVKELSDAALEKLSKSKFLNPAGKSTAVDGAIAKMQAEFEGLAGASGEELVKRRKLATKLTNAKGTLANAKTALAKLEAKGLERSDMSRYTTLKATVEKLEGKADDTLYHGTNKAKEILKGGFQMGPKVRAGSPYMGDNLVEGVYLSKGKDAFKEGGSLEGVSDVLDVKPTFKKVLKSSMEGLGKLYKEAKIDPMAEEAPSQMRRYLQSKGYDAVDLGEEIIVLDSKAIQAVPKGDAGGAVPRDEVLKAVDDARKGLGRAVSRATTSAKTALVKYTDRLKKLGPTVSQSEIGKIVRDIDNDINWEDKAAKPLNQALEALRTSLDDSLKGANKEYGAAMEPVSEGVRLLKKAQSMFGVKKVVGKGYAASDMTASKLKSALNENRVDSQDVLEALKKVTGRDWLSEADLAGKASEFTKGSKGGSRRVNLGAILGATVGGGTQGAVGGGAGAALGALGGAYLDEQGGPIAGSIVDKVVRMTKNMGPVPTDALARAIAAAVKSGTEKRR